MISSRARIDRIEIFERTVVRSGTGATETWTSVGTSMVSVAMMSNQPLLLHQQSKSNPLYEVKFRGRRTYTYADNAFKWYDKRTRTYRWLRPNASPNQPGRSDTFWSIYECKDETTQLKIAETGL